MFGTQAICQAIGRQFNIAISKDGVLFYVALHHAAFNEPFGQILLPAHLVHVYGFAIRHIHAVIVEDLTRLQIPFGNSANLDHRASQGGATESRNSTTRAIAFGTSKCTRW